jgi:hypothetical protein
VFLDEKAQTKTNLLRAWAVGGSLPIVAFGSAAARVLTASGCGRSSTNAMGQIDAPDPWSGSLMVVDALLVSWLRILL